MRLLAGPERIESGWWDAASLMRLAMCVATTLSPFPMRNEWLWIFRCRAGWFLHGVFA
ncbi:MAG: hypothetical protein V5B35_19610 [Candidatus Accumulibacter necessarius]